jgi:molybdenum cofactor cytidylyltransferase
LEIEAQPEGLSAIILAAGMSRRMGSPKMLLPLGDETMLQRVVRTYLKILPASQIIVVTGHHCEKIERSLSGWGVRFGSNAEYEKGMLWSVKVGIAAALTPSPGTPGEGRGEGSSSIPPVLSSDEDPAPRPPPTSTCARGTGDAFLALGDQPCVQVETLQALIRSHENSGAIVSQPSFEGKSGHPLLISHRGFAEILALREDATLKTFVNNHTVNTVEVDDPYVLNDVDTPSDYQRLLRSETCSLVENS